MKLEYATEAHIPFIEENDYHLRKELIPSKITGHEIYLIRDNQETIIGWMRYGYFWDNIPFMNMIWIDEPYRGQGIGKQAVNMWERDMQRKGYGMVMTSTQADEEAQHFYRKLGYKDAGCLLLDSQPLEILLTKKL